MRARRTRRARRARGASSCSSPYVVVARSGSDGGDARRRARIATRRGDASGKRRRSGGEDELDVDAPGKLGREGAAGALGRAQEHAGGDVGGERERQLEQKPRQE